MLKDDPFVSVLPESEQQQIINMPVARLMGEALKIYGPLVLLLFGLPGNILSYMVMNEAQFRHTTTSYFIRVLAICDNGYLISRCLQRYMLSTFLRPVLIEWNALRAFCLEYLFTATFTTAASRYVLVLMTYDRLVALLFPLRARAFPGMKIAKILTFTVLLWSFIDGFTYLFAQYSEIYSHWLCPYYFDDFFGDLYTLLWNVTTVTSCSLLVVANALIAWTLYSSAHRMKSLQEDGKTDSKTETQKRSAKNRQISLMLLLVSCFYIISNVPREIDSQFWRYYPELATSVPDLLSLTLEFSIFFEALNYAINFYLYVASCHKFRATLRRKFMMSKKGSEKNDS